MVARVDRDVGVANIDLAVAHAAVKQVDVAEKVVNKRRRRMVVNFLGCSGLLDPSVVEHHDPVGQLERLFLIMSDEDARDMQFVVQPSEPAPQLLADLGVERAKRFVEQKHLGFDRQRARERDPLPLAA